MDKPLALLILIMVVTAVSGCTVGPVTVTSNGIEIESLVSDFSSVSSGQSVRFSLLIRNTGSADSSEVFAEVLGIDHEWGPNPGQEKPPNEDECWWNGEHFSLYAPDAIAGTQGQAHQCTWNYEAPELPSGQSITYEVTGRIFYRYSSTTSTMLAFGTYDEIRELQNSGQSIPAQTTTSSEGPIKITIETQSPVMFDEQDSSVTFPLYITIQNLGGGVVCNVEDPNQCKDYIGTDPQNRVGVSFSSSSGIDLQDCSIQELSILGGTNSYSCAATATSLPDILSQKTITAAATYSYYSDKEISVTVTGQQY